ncbi:MAG: VWA domain-containing protein [Candidatus Riflebacteria bacterium]|nr:VWA domain-containing protein [Candidatus Riflebacteria bacterium]
MAEELSVQVQFDRDYLKRGVSNQELVALINFSTQSEFARKYPKAFCDLILVVDTSGSMDEAFNATAGMSKRAGVLEAARSMATKLESNDTFSLICFDSKEYIELDHVSGHEKQRITDSLQAIQRHSGSTNFESAFSAALRLSGSGSNSSRKVIFLTDGHSSAGSDATARKHNQAIAGLGVTTDCLGVGGDFKFSEMKQYTDVSNGKTEILDTPGQAGQLFQGLLAGAQRSLISNVVFQLIFPKDCRDVEVFQAGPENRWFGMIKPQKDGGYLWEKTLPTLENDTDYQFLFRFRIDLPADPQMSRFNFLKYRLSYDVPVKNLKSEMLRNEDGIHLQDTKDQESTNTDVHAKLVGAEIEKLNVDCDTAFRNKEWKKLGDLLQQMIKKAESIRENAKVKEFRDRLGKLVKDGHLTQADMNQVARISSKTTKSSRKGPDTSAF